MLGMLGILVIMKKSNLGLGKRLFIKWPLTTVFKNYILKLPELLGVDSVDMVEAVEWVIRGPLPTLRGPGGMSPSRRSCTGDGPEQIFI